MKFTSKTILFAFATSILATTQLANAAFTGSGTYTVGSGGDYTTLADFLDDACKVRELTGTVSSAGTVITGTGTLFTSQVAPGDLILASTGAFRGNSQVLTVVSVDSDTQITVATAPSAALAATKVTRQKPSFPTTLTGDVTASIISNLTETVNSQIILNTAGFNLTIKPAVTITPTITFTRAEDQSGFTGNLIIGSNNVGANAILASTDNIIIDGSNTVGGSTRDLTLTSTMTYASSVVVHVTGDADNVQIKNAIITNSGTSTGSNTSAVRFSTVQFAAGATDFTLAGYAAAGTYAPDSWLVENCALTATTVSQGHGVNVSVTGTIPAGTAQNGFIIRNNDIVARIRGVFVNGGYGYTLENNRMRIGEGGVTTLDSWGLLNNNSNTPPANTTTVRNNRITVFSSSTTTFGPTGISLGSMGSGYDRIANVYNNEIILINNGARAAAAVAATRGIQGTSGISWRIYNNSIFIPDNAATTNSLVANGINQYGIGGFAVGSSNIDIRNNVISVAEANVAAISLSAVPTPTGNGAALLLGNNILSATGGAFVGRTGNVSPSTSYSTLAAWQAVSPAYDPNSSSVDPLSLFSSTTGPNYSLALIGDPTGVEWLAAPISIVATDFEGTARSATRPYKGFDEKAGVIAGTATAPSSPAITSSTVAENSAADTVIGTLSVTDPDAGDGVIWTLTNNGGGAVKLFGNSLRVNNPTLLNFETSPTIAITALATDTGGDSVSFPFNLTLTNVNEAPTDLALAGGTVAENSATGTVVGTLSTTDVDAGDTFVYTLVTGTGDTNNGLFTIVGNELRVNGALDFETLGASLSVRIQTQDVGGTGLTFAKAVAITLTDVTNEDTDGDGINDNVEGADASNPQAATFVSAVGAATLRLTTSAGNLALVSAVPSPGSEPANTTLPLGAVSFSITGLSVGGSADVVLTYPTTSVNNALKVNGTTYSAIPGAVVTTTSVSYTIVDGSALDADGTANGTIVDPVAPVIVGSSTSDWMVLNN